MAVANQRTKKNYFSKVFKNSQELCDVISVIIHCPQEKTYLIAHDVYLDYHIPYIPVSKHSWNVQVQSFIKEYIGITTDKIGKLWRIIRFWRSDNESYLQNVIFEVALTPNVKKKSTLFKLNRFSKTAWMSLVEFEQMYISRKQGMCPDVIAHIPIEYDINSNLSIYEDCAVIQNYNLIEVTKDNVINDDRTNTFDQLFSGLALSIPDIETLHKEYLKFTYPNVIMGLKSLSRFASVVGWNDYLYKTAYRGVDLTDKGGITYREFLYLICAIDPKSDFKGFTIDARNRFIFRCFDMNRKDRLSQKEFTALIQSLRSSRGPNILSNLTIDAEIEQTMIAMDLRPGFDVPLNSFIKLAGSSKYRYFLNILRATNTITTFTANMRERLVQQLNAKRYSVSDSQPKALKKVEFVLSSYVSRIYRGCVSEVIDIDKIEGLQLKDMKNQLPRSLSAYLQDRNASPQNEVLFYLKFFANSIVAQKEEETDEQSNKVEGKRNVLSGKEEFSWGSTDFTQFVQLLIEVCATVSKILQAEKRMLILKAPVYIIGDIHGNIQDLCCFEKEIWPLGIALLPCSLLFLGDYVDRGDSSIEVVAYLFAHKARSPQSIYLVRGNHEIRSTQKQQVNYNTFYKECMKRCGSEMGKQLWNAVNDAFDCMPLAACIEGKIFCCHGGIPPPWICPTIQVIQSIPCPLVSPENNSVAWELLWNDPAKESELSERAKLEMGCNEGFSVNVKRMTGHIFNDKALDKFLQVNQLSFLIRAHEFQKAGFQIHNNWKTLTVFSSSYYAGANKASCVLIQNNAKIKILQFVTDEYHPDKIKTNK